MQFSCTQENLLQGLSVVAHITGKNINLPVLGNVLIRADKGIIQLHTTNLEISISCQVRGRVEADGEYSVPAKVLLDFISLLPSGKVSFLLKDDGLEICSNEHETLVRGMPASEFPLLPQLQKDASFHLKTEELKRAIGRVAFAVSPSESRPELSGVACFFNPENQPGRVALVATDSYRLGEQIISTDDASRQMCIIVPAKAMNEIGRIFSSYKNEIDSPEEVGWSVSDNQLIVTYGSVELVTRLIEARFPDYQNIVPTAFQTEAIVSRSELSKAVRAASLFTRKEINDIHFSIDPSGSVVVESSDEGTGKTRSTVSAQVTGDANQVVLNYKYLMDGLQAFGGERVKVSAIGSSSPVLLLPEDAEDLYRYLVMPIRQ